MNPTSQTSQTPTRINLYGYNTLARHFSFAIIVGIMMFLAAGTTNWQWGWIFTISHFLAWQIMSFALARWNPELLNERGKRSKQLTGTKTWDWVIMAMYAVIIIIQPIIAGLDYRNGWSTPPATWVYILGDVFIILGYGIVSWAMVYNRNFEGTVRIQEQRGHQVAASGPYRYVRHPGYVGVILTFIALPLGLGAWMALIPGAIGIILFIIRTALEDRTLQAELPGYSEFAQKTRYRLLPGVW